MTKKTLSPSALHKIPADLQTALLSNAAAHAAWEDLTPLARNEWICWVTYPKKIETRNEHIMRMVTQLKQGKRRPCCWIGCIHRTDKPVSPSVRGILNKQKNRKGSQR